MFTQDYLRRRADIYLISACISFHQSWLDASDSCHICLSLIHILRVANNRQSSKSVILFLKEVFLWIPSTSFFPVNFLLKFFSGYCYQKCKDSDQLLHNSPLFTNSFFFFETQCCFHLFSKTSDWILLNFVLKQVGLYYLMNVLVRDIFLVFFFNT